jgi:hypothetical protein
MNRAHWPFQLGYLASSAARTPPADMAVATGIAAAIATIEVRFNMQSSSCPAARPRQSRIKSADGLAPQ